MRCFLCSLAIVLTAFPLWAQNDGAAERTAAGCGPNEQMFDVDTTDQKHPAAQPEPGKAVVYFFVDYLSTTTTRAGIDGTWVGANHGRSYFFVPVAPGEHNVCMQWQSGTFKKTAERSGEAMHIKVEEGKTYYVRLTAEPNRMRLELADEAEGHFLIGSSEFATSHPKK